MAKNDIELRKTDTNFEELDHLHRAISQRAYDFFKDRGTLVGNAVGDWFVKSTRPRWLGVRVRPALLETPDVSSVPSAPQIPSHSSADERREANTDQIAADYAGAKRRLDALVEDADEVGERLERLGHGLSAHPMRMIIGLPDRFVENSSECDIVPGHALPPIERLMSLTNDIREAAQNVGDLRERLILLGRKDVVEQPDGFFK